MLTILPLASRLNPPGQVHAAVTRFSARLGARGIAHAIVEPGFQDPSALLIVTDGDLESCGDVALRCRTQIDVRLQADLRDLLARPSGNHHVLVRGHWAARLREYQELYVASHAGAAAGA